MTSKYNTQHEFINIPGHIIVVDYIFFIGLFWKNCRFQGTDEDVRVMVFNATFDTISVILWRSTLLVAETRVPGKKPPTYHNSLI